MNLDFMSTLRDNYKPTEADLDMVIEDATGKPVKLASLHAGIISMRRRIAQLEAEKAKLLAHLEKDSDATLKAHLTGINQDLATARERFGHYQAQVGKQN